MSEQEITSDATSSQQEKQQPASGLTLNVFFLNPVVVTQIGNGDKNVLIGDGPKIVSTNGSTVNSHACPPARPALPKVAFVPNMTDADKAKETAELARTTGVNEPPVIVNGELHHVIRRLLWAIVGLLVLILAVLTAILATGENHAQHDGHVIQAIQDDTRAIKGDVNAIRGDVHNLNRAQVNSQPALVDRANIPGEQPLNGHVELIRLGERLAGGAEGGYGVMEATGYRLVITGEHTDPGLVTAHVRSGNGQVNDISLSGYALNANGGEKSYTFSLKPGEELVNVTIVHLDQTTTLKP